ncbi:MAG: hypothetical protein LHW44_01580 [Candidatus Cloacimonetes bacterium]|nr:hypothetical protein [Candidatus Cloacimonadota bacterium]
MKDKDFTVKAYEALLLALQEAGYQAQTFAQFIKSPQERAVILRHDVDKMPLNSLAFAALEKRLGMQASYYFRMVPVSYKPSVIKAIGAMGHEIGYHYEDMDLAKGDKALAIESFTQNLAFLRQLAPIHTICMHGSPLSKFDNRDLWQDYSYRDFNIIGEPYFDIDYTQVLYLTDTGRSWNNRDASIRDKVDTPFNFEVKSTFHLIELIEGNELPDKIMINTHPQRWNDGWQAWAKELVAQKLKNVVKRALTLSRN